MKKKFLSVFILICWQSFAQAANLLEVYEQAQTSDPVFLQAVAQRLSTREGVPISAAALLPNIAFTASPSADKVGYSGSNFDPVVDNSGSYVNPRNLTQRNFSMSLSLTQTIFNYAQFSAVAQQVSLAKGADATLNAALQNLMIRVASAYFAILKDEDNLSYAEASKLAYAEQLDQVRQQYKVGLKTITDVYTAQASYDSAVATYIAAETTLSNDRENLRVITGVYYPHLSSLSDEFPLVSPQPRNVETWVKKAVAQNWSIKSGQYNVSAAREQIRQQYSGHLPTINVQTTFSKEVSDNINNYSSFTERNGPGTTSDRGIALNVNVPIFSGGGVVAQTNQASYNYQVAQQQLEQTIRSTINTTRQSYLSIVAGISQIKADKEAIQSTISSLEGLEASYRVGTETLVDVLNQQQKVFQAQTQYATDRYAFVNNILALKQAAGTLSFDDLRAINAWLIDKKRKTLRRMSVKSLSTTRHNKTLHMTKQ
ncbi:Outer membrane protein TolC [Aquicella siphonis]|uniref:Outer membrane protein TolC n=1 Tax=Aquicella siphonis TaxID=254247 RepID=A0A5E4PDM5_9COXI|nr:TolC family outer membrane protein [Aquicella siphonis]VVC75049.1 Outer membrane protein TolC [Aquicella siphonis]